jgi:hypothetical protein
MKGRAEWESSSGAVMKLRKKRTSGPSARLGFAACVIAGGGALLYLAVHWRASPLPRSGGKERPPLGASEPSSGPAQHWAGGNSGGMQASPSIRGTVIGSPGGPIAGASVCALPADGACCAPEACALTDAQGTFKFAAGAPPPSALLAFAAGYTSLRADFEVLVEAMREQGSVSLTLVPAEGSELAGRVLDAMGGAVAGARVTATGRPAHGTPLSSTESGANGAFSLQVPGGPIELVARAPGYSIAATSVSAPRHDVTLVLAPAASISGRVVVGDSDRPAAGVLVTATYEDGAHAPALGSRSAEDGGFRLDGLSAGRYQLDARSERFVSDSVTLPLGISQILEDVLVRVEPATLLQGHIRVGGEDCEDGGVLLTGQRVLFAATQPGGVVRLEGVPAGRYQVAIHCRHGERRSETLDVAGETVVRFWELAEGLSVRGTVQRSSGAPLPRARVHVRPAQDGSIQEMPAAGSSVMHEVECLTDEVGHFECADLAPGAYDCSVGGDWDSYSPTVRVTVSPGASPEIVLVTKPLATVRAIIPASATDTPVNLTAWLWRDDSNFAVRGVRIRDGFVFEHLPLGRYVLHAGPTPAENPPTVVLEHDGQIETLEVSVPPVEGVAGRVVDGRGLPVADAWVRARYARGSVRESVEAGEPALTNERGEFDLVGLLRGSYVLSATGEHGEASPVEVQSGERNLVLRIAEVNTSSDGVRGDDISPLSRANAAQPNDGRAAAVRD